MARDFRAYRDPDKTNSLRQRGPQKGKAPPERDCQTFRLELDQRPIKQSLKRCTLSWPTWLRPSVASGSSGPTIWRHFSASDVRSGCFCGALRGVTWKGKCDERKH